MKKTAVTIISSLPPIIGLSPYTKELVSELSRHISIRVLGFRHIYPEFLYPGKLYDFSSKPLQEHETLNIRNVLDWFNPFGWILEAFRITTPIIHAQWWSYPLAPVYFTILALNRLRGKKIILTVHNVEPHEKSLFKKLLNRSVFCLADEYIVHTNINKKQLSKYAGKRPIHVIPHGILEPPLKGVSKQEARAKLHIDPQDKILLCFGHIRPYKGLDTAINALRLIKDPSIKLLIAGKCWEEWEKYETLIAQHDLKNRIILKLGFIKNDDVETIFTASDLVLLPYKHFDAQSGVGALVVPFGIPLIVSAVGGLKDYVDDERCVVKPDDPKDLSCKIENILADSELYTKIISDIQCLRKKLNWTAIAHSTIKLYQ